jgi:hypothetical protein
MRLRREAMHLLFKNGQMGRNTQTWPMDIDIIDSFGPDESVTTTVENVWIEELGYAYTATEWVIVDHFTFEAESIYAT